MPPQINTRLRSTEQRALAQPPSPAFTSRASSASPASAFMVNISMPESAPSPSDQQEWTEEDRQSVKELRDQLRHMREVMDESEYADALAAIGNVPPGKKPRVPNRASVIDGSFMSFVFISVFTIIVIVSYYAFKNLYYAVLKKFPTIQHTEL